MTAAAMTAVYAASGGTLPAPVTAVVGRDALLVDIDAALKRRATRLLTLTGLGGVGKTRLAVEVGWRRSEQLGGRVSWVDLSAVTNALTVPEEMCRQLGIASSVVGATAEPRLVSQLSDAPRLLIVDNLEQVLSATPLLSRLATACPKLIIIATSRRPLRLAGEHVIVVPPLDVDAAGGGAVELYCQRALAVDAGFPTDPAALAAVTDVCRTLDGLPLAIELAAARSRVLRPHQLLHRLRAASSSAQPWASLSTGPADAATRHRTLHNAIAWSIELLEPAERVLFRRLGIFVGAFDADAVEAVCSDGPAGEDDRVTDLPSDRVLDGLESLVDLQLLEPVADGGDDVQRFRLLQTIASAARVRLAEAGEVETLRDRHAAFHLELAATADDGLESADEMLWYRRVDASIADFDAAFEHLQTHGRFDELAVSVGALGPYWLNAGRFALGRRWLTIVEEAAPALQPEVANLCAGWSARLDLDGQAGIMSAADARDVLERLERVFSDAPAEPASRRLRAAEHLSYALRLYGDPARGQLVAADAVRFATAAGSQWWRAEHLVRLALLADQDGDSAGALRYAREALVAADAAGNARARARARQVEIFTDELSAAQVVAGLEQVLAASYTFGDRRGAVTTAIALASMAAAGGDVAGFGQRIADVITESRTIGYHHGIGLAQTTLVLQAAVAGDHAAALTGHAALSAGEDTIHRQLPHGFAQEYDAAVTAAASALGPEATDAAAAEGRGWSWERGVDAALSRARTLAATHPATVPAPLAAATPEQNLGPEPLTRRELEVLTLIAHGLTNQEIADRLVLSTKTVMHHSSHIYRKLGVRGRAEAAALAGRRRLLALS